MQAKAIEIASPRGDQSLPALLVRPAAARWLLILAHGAGAGIQHSFMESISTKLAERDIATLRYAFPYMASGRRAPDRPPLLEATVRSAIATAASEYSDLPLLAGGKSMGGRMTSRASAELPDPRVHGLVFFGFPLHAAGKPGTQRAEHLLDVTTPMLFLQGNRDKLADLELLTPICKQLGKRATLHIIEGADHSFHVLKRSGRTDDAVLDELADSTRSFAETLPCD